MVAGKGASLMLMKLIVCLSLGSLLLIAGCGGGGGGTDLTPGNGGNPAPQNSKVIISFSLLSSQRLPFRMGGVEVTATLPAGMTPTTGNASIPRQITAGLEAGSAASGLFATNFILGNYSAPRVKVSIAADPLKAGIGPGELIKLTCVLANGVTLKESDRQALLDSIVFKASGIDPSAAINPSPLNQYLKKDVTVTLVQ